MFLRLRNSNHRTPPLGAGLRPRRLRRRSTPDATATATAKAAKELRSPRVQGGSRSLPRCACADLGCACPCVSAFSSPTRVGDSPPLALATHTRMAGGQGVSVRTATAKPFKSQGATNMSNDKAQELTEQINNSIVALCAETDAAKQSATYRAWLSTVSRFYKYSFCNCLLIWSQAPEATRIAGFNTWKSLGRFVKKGESGIRILAPIVRKVEEEKNGSTEKTSRVAGFRSVSVFDYAQTDGAPLPELTCNATEGGETLLPLLEQAVATLNISLIYKAISGNAEGISKGGVIEIEETLDTPARCGVIAHELAHEILHKTNRESTTRQQRELEAESVSYAVLAHFGMHSESRFYLATYDVSAEMLTASLQTIGNAAKQIINLIAEAAGAAIEEGEGGNAPALAA